MKDAFESLLEQVQVLSLDVFDTTLGRLCALPDDAFLLMEEALVERHGEVMEGFGRKRCGVDTRARRRAWDQRQAEEITLLDIHTQLLEENPDWPCTVEELSGLEMEVEEQLLYPLQPAREMIAKARDMGKRIIFVSDMYLPQAFCEQCLRDNGFGDYDAFYLSSTVGVLKHSGKLFDHVIEQLGIPPGEILHVGDNSHSDVKQAEQAGMKTFLVEKAITRVDRFPENPWKPVAGKADRDGRESLLLGLSVAGCLREERFEDPLWYRTGYQVGGPLVYGYIQFLIRRIRGRGIRKVYFLSRDGYIMKQVYERLTSGLEDCPEADYLYASRRALNFASIRELDAKTENWLAEGIQLTVGDFLRRIGLDPDRHLQAIRETGLSGPEHKVVGGWEYTRLRQLYHRILPSILEAAARERETYLQYLRHKGVFEASPFVLVDVGWMTSIQHSFARMVREVDPDLTLEGYYLGTYPEAVERADAHSRHVHYLMEYGQPAETLHIIRHCVCLIEFFFAAPEKTFLYMEGDARNGFRPVLAGIHENKDDLPKLEQIHQGILDYSEAATAATGGRGLGIKPAEVMRLLQRMLAEPTGEEARHLGEICYADGYGSYFHHTFMARPSGLRKLGLSKKKWKAEFKHCHWPKGYYMRLSPLERFVFRLMHPSHRFSKPYG